MMTYCIRGNVTNTKRWMDKEGTPGTLVTIRDDNQTMTIATTNAPPEIGDLIEAIGGLRVKSYKGYTNTVLTRATIQILIPAKQSETEGGETPATRREPTQGRTN